MKLVIATVLLLGSFAHAEINDISTELKPADKAIVAKYQKAMDEALVKYAKKRSDEEWNRGQAGCQYGYTLAGKQPAVPYSDLNHVEVLYGTAFFSCTDDDGMNSLERETFLYTCNEAATTCDIVAK